MNSELKTELAELIQQQHLQFDAVFMPVLDAQARLHSQVAAALRTPNVAVVVRAAAVRPLCANVATVLLLLLCALCLLFYGNSDVYCVSQ